MATATPSKAAEAGLKFFADLNKAGNFVPVIGKAASLAQGATPIIIRWDYNALSDRDTLKGNPQVEVVVPKTGVVAGVYVQAISAFAPHPNAAKLWMEHLYSDEGQIAWLKGYCHPIRFQDLAKNNKIPADLLAKLPPAASYEKAVFPTLEQQDTAKTCNHRPVGQGGRREREVVTVADAAPAPDGPAPPRTDQPRRATKTGRMTQANEAVPLPAIGRRRGACASLAIGSAWRRSSCSPFCS